MRVPQDTGARRAPRPPFDLALIGDLHRDLRLDEPRLLVGGGSRLLGLDALGLSFCLALIGLGELLAQPRDEQLRRHGQSVLDMLGVARFDLLLGTIDAGLCHVALDDANVTCRDDRGARVSGDAHIKQIAIDPVLARLQLRLLRTMMRLGGGSWNA